MTQNNRFNQQDLLAKDKIEVSSYLIYTEKYRKGLSPVAILMYQYIMKRFSVSEMKYQIAMEEDSLEDFTFIDDDGSVFCIVSNDELMFVLNISEPTVVKCKKELKKVGLLEEIKQTTFKSNRLYLNKVSTDPKEKTLFDKQLKEYRNKKSAARKLKNSKRDFTKKEVVATTNKPIEKVRRTFVGVVNLKNLSSVNLKKFSSVNLKNLRQSTKELTSTKEFTSTKQSFKSFKHEEEEYIYMLCKENPVFDYIFDFLTEKKYDKQIAMKTILLCKEKGLELCTVLDVEKQYKHMMEKEKREERIFDFADYFTTGLKMIADISIAQHQYEQEELSKQELSSTTSVPFYNWLEERE